jgi:hypothetical protein
MTVALPTWRDSRPFQRAAAGGAGGAGVVDDEDERAIAIGRLALKAGSVQTGDVFHGFLSLSLSLSLKLASSSSRERPRAVSVVSD